MFRFAACVSLALLPALAEAAPLLLNGDFSAGTTGWTVGNGGVGQGGIVEVLSSLGSQSPAAEPQFALLETGPAATFSSPTPGLASLSQSFTLAAADTVDISFRYTPLTARFTGGAAVAGELDRFIVRLTGPAAFSTDLLSLDVSNPAFTPVPDAGGVVSSPAGANFFELVAASLFNASLALGPGTYTLDFRVENDGDGFFDSGLLIEGVSAESRGSTAPVPEPAMAALLALSGIVLSVRRSRRGPANVMGGAR